MPASPAAPYSPGQWVCGDSFYGRAALVEAILDGPSDCIWLLGTRRIGKTSLLKQLEWLTVSSPARGYLPLFWDLQGADTFDELYLSFRESLFDAGLRFRQVDFRPADLEHQDLFTSIGRLRRHLRSRGLKLLLLCDEAEELLHLGRVEPELLHELRRALEPAGDFRSVLASTIRLWPLTERQGETSPFLHGFTPPVYVRPLQDNDARSLVFQTNLPTDARPRIEAAVAEKIRAACDNHPLLLQVLCQRFLEVGDFGEALRQIAADDMVAALFSSDLEALSAADLAILRSLSDRDATERGWLQTRLPLDAVTVDGSLHRLEDLGLARRDERDRFEVRNQFLRRWLNSGSDSSSAQHRDVQRLAAAGRADEILADLSRAEEPHAWSPDDLFELAYDPLRQLAGRYLRRERPNHTLQPTALVHEAYLKLIDQSRVDWKGRSHFFAVGAKIMRRILIDHARSRKRVKRGGDLVRISISGLAASPLGGDLDPAQLLELHAALEKLAEIDERQARVVELRFFGGLNLTEVAEALGISRRTADGDWAKARAWLERELAG